MRYAAIDLGTNTFHLIIAEQSGNKIAIIHKINEPVKLGEEITKNNVIIPAAFERGLNCLKSFRAAINSHQVDKVRAVATSGIRSSNNGQNFIAAVKQQTGIEIEIINGDQEAEYIYQGVKSSGVIMGKSLIMDIGGGSTEFILCDEDEIIWKKSYNIGASRLMQKFFTSDPLSKTDSDAIITHLQEELKALNVIVKEFGPQTLIGSAGAFETYAEMINPTVNLAQISNAEIDLPKYHQLSKQLLQSTHQQRSQMKGLIPLRVDMIVMATLQINYILNQFNFKHMKLSTYDLKMGILASLAS